MKVNQAPISAETWKIEKIGVIGPGIVGMPMAAMLAKHKSKLAPINLLK